ncbi:MAG: hypothetical protein WCT03_01875 [Candidatus Obscuribacterales bacterium]|jgi:hypothetical protein
MFEKFLANSGNALHWLMILFVFQGIFSGFSVNQGYWQIDSPSVVNYLNYAKQALSLFICYRLIKPVGVQDIKALIILFLIPSSSIFYACFHNLDIEIALITCRWHPYLRIPAALWLVLSCTIWSNWPTHIMGSFMSSCLTTTSGDFVSSTDGIYNLYKYPRINQENGNPYALFRVITLFPGVELVKGLDDCQSKSPVSVRRSAEGIYYIEGGMPFTKQ